MVKLMFLDNKYTKIYFELMKKAKERNSTIIGENHHIIPKSLGGKDNKENIVKLTYREHFIAHALLTKMCKTQKKKRSMSYAFV